jgi:serine/threonine-protein kinase/endoribonuclease IRE1
VFPCIVSFSLPGTIVYEGVLDSRPVAVKRLLRQFYNLARKEINVLVVSDEHPNVVRCFAMEEDREFVYLALERCKTSLAQFINDQGGAALLTVRHSR